MSEGQYRIVSNGDPDHVISDPDCVITDIDYVISYNKLDTSNQPGGIKKLLKAIRDMMFKEEEKASKQPRIISKLLKAIRDMKFKAVEEVSTVDANRHYILVYVEEHNLSILMDRAEIIKIPITLRDKLEDFKLKKGDNHDNGSPGDNHDNNSPGDNHDNGSPGDNHDNGSPGDNHDNGSPGDNHDNGSPRDDHDNGSPEDNHDNGSPSSKRSWPMQLLEDWFLINLNAGYKKIEYRKSKHSILLEKADNNPFEDSRVRGYLIHDLLKDINISDKSQSSVYMGLEWMHSKGYIDKYFICHNQRDKFRSDNSRKFNKDNPEKQLSRVKQYLQSVTWIRQYFGEKVAFAFAWHSIYLSYALSLPAVLGNGIS